VSTLAHLAAALRRPATPAAPVPYTPRASLTLGGQQGPERSMRSALDATAAVGTLYSIVNRCSTAVADTTWHLYRKRRPGDDPDAPRTEVTAHPALALLADPNPFHTTQELLEIGQQHQELTGETYLLVVRAGRTPVELWPLSPDRVTPRKHPARFLDGWTYTIGDEKIPLDIDDVIQIRTPNPADPYRGLSPVAALLAPMYGLDAAIRWNATFFRNQAAPGGVIEVEKNLGDDEFDRLAQSWRTQHQGASNAHRVGILEAGMHFVPTGISQRDMDFIGGIQLSRELVMEAFGISKTMLGMTEDVNRATAETALTMFAQFHVVGRLNRWRAALNDDLLPMFPGSEALEFDYDSPVPEDGEREVAALTARATAWATLLAAGADPAWAAEQAGLPEPLMAAPKPAPALPAAPGHPEPDGDETPADDDTENDGDGPDDVPPSAWLRPLIVAAAPPPEPDPAETPATREDLDSHQADWEAALAAILVIWVGVRAAQSRDLAEQAAAATTAAEAAQIAAGDHGGTDALTSALTALWDRTAAAEAAQSHGLGYHDVTPPAAPDELADWAAATARLLTADIEQAARRRAIQAAGGDPADVAAAVTEALDQVTDAGPRAELGGALTRAQGTARLRTMDQGPVIAYYASAHLDSNVCEPCKHGDGMWLGNTLDAVAVAYPNGQFIHCLGGPRCRCQVVATYRSGNPDTSYEKQGPVMVPGRQEES